MALVIAKAWLGLKDITCGGPKCHVCATSGCAQPLECALNKRCSCARFRHWKDRGAGKLRGDESVIKEMNNNKMMMMIRQ